MNKDKKISLLNLQREYLEKTLQHIDEMLNCADELAESQDADIIESLLFKIDELDAKADLNYKIACDIENVIKR